MHTHTHAQLHAPAHAHASTHTTTTTTTTLTVQDGLCPRGRVQRSSEAVDRNGREEDDYPDLLSHFARS
eukprot:11180658-Alexandrium_andersonii.AAC.1